jgi:hypothetical protein
LTQTGIALEQPLSAGRASQLVFEFWQKLSSR